MFDALYVVFFCVSFNDDCSKKYKADFKLAIVISRHRPQEANIDKLLPSLSDYLSISD